MTIAEEIAGIVFVVFLVVTTIAMGGMGITIWSDWLKNRRGK